MINCYDPINNLWSSSIKTLLIAGEKINVASYTNCVLRMDVDWFENYTKMIRARSSPAAISYQGMLVIIGGKGNENDKSSSTDLFDSVTGQ